jgi:hypothetical protein
MGLVLGISEEGTISTGPCDEEAISGPLVERSVNSTVHVRLVRVALGTANLESAVRFQS